jgi:hypothetical protein
MPHGQERMARLTGRMAQAEHKAGELSSPERNIRASDKFRATPTKLYGESMNYAKRDKLMKELKK